MSLGSKIKSYWSQFGGSLRPLAVWAGAIEKPALILEEVGDNPDPAAMSGDMLYMVKTGEWPKWADFKCPCGCGDVISISIAQGKNSWRLSRDFWGRPSLFPSVWRKAACKSHFWVKKGKIHWS
jgi:hypothetical protein